jgi:hypothetical protein
MTTAPPNPPTPGALERLAWFVRHLIGGIVTITCCNRIHPYPASRINDRLNAFRRRMEWLAARIAAGTYKPRPKTGPRKTPVPRKPRPPDRVAKKRNWLGELLFEASGYRGNLDRLIREPGMVALIQAAPAETVRPLRSFCWMLGLPSPQILALPRKPRPAKPEKPKPPEPAPQTGSEILMSPASPPELRAKWAKPKGSLSNRLYRQRPPPKARGSPQKA